jgi:response regulator of citrate/malate metabolism
MASVRTAMRYGAVQFLIKPFDLETLRDRVTRYVELHARRSAEGTADQQQIDDLFGVMRQAAEVGVRLPKGHSAATAQLVLQALTEADVPVSANELAQRTGISRATAQRYLSTLADTGTVRLQLRYGSTGRPEHRYELVSPHAQRPAH